MPKTMYNAPGALAHGQDSNPLSTSVSDVHFPRGEGYKWSESIYSSPEFHKSFGLELRSVSGGAGHLEEGRRGKGGEFLDLTNCPGLSG